MMMVNKKQHHNNMYQLLDKILLMMDIPNQIHITQMVKIQPQISMVPFVILQVILKEFKKDMKILTYLMKDILHKIIHNSLKNKFQFKLHIYLFSQFLNNLNIQFKSQLYQFNQLNPISNHNHNMIHINNLCNHNHNMNHIQINSLCSQIFHLK